MKNESGERVIDLDRIKILSQTKDSLIIQTEELLDTMYVLQNAGRKLIDLIDDPYIRYGLSCERYILCYAKGLFLKKILLLD